MIYHDTWQYSNLSNPADEMLKYRKARLQALFENISDFFENSEKYNLVQRSGQYAMALSVFDVIDSLDNLIIEAGVGIGKSYAYLVPLLYLNAQTKMPFIVSTSTIALQEQLERDINTLSKQLGINIDVVIAKGMGNFICQRRLDSFLSIATNESYIKDFSNDSQDRKDYPNIKDEVWKQVNVEKCSYSRCDYCKSCEFAVRRKKMKNTNGVIICNHDLLIEDLSRDGFGNKLLNNVRYIVCDEAHNLESKIRSAKTREINLVSVKRTLEKAISLLDRLHIPTDEYTSVLRLIEMLKLYIDKNVLVEISKLREQQIDLEDCSGLKLAFTEEVLTLSNKIYRLIEGIMDSIQLYSDDNNDELEEELYEIDKGFEYLSQGNSSNELFWIERRRDKNYIYHAPKRIDKIARDLFFESPNHSFVFTSATLCTKANDYSYFRNNIGAIDVKNVVEEYAHKSPYDYDNKTLLYCPDDITSPKQKEKYLNELVERINELILLTEGKALVLFTSKSDMHYVYSKLGSKINGIDVFIQNQGSSQDLVKEKFRNNINSILFSTGIFWEGIDIKGPSLSNLIIARLPFPVVDPIIEYKSSLYKDGFSSVYLPEMLIKLKQGVGRLIRCESDTGIVSILDSRVTRYEDAIKETLPIKNFTKDEGEIKEFVKKLELNKKNNF